MIRFPSELADATGEGEIRAGGTDLHERRASRLVKGPLVDLRDVGDARVIAPGPGGTRIGALVRIAEIAGDDEVRAGYPALAEAAGGLATPQIRNVATVGGNLLQHTRCWYYRTPEAECFRRGGTACAARKGDHLFHACFDLGPCASVHASTLAMALLAYDAGVEVIGESISTVAALLGDGGDATRHHMLPSGAVLSAIVLPPPKLGERSVYVRAISRARAEWPLVEVAVRLGVTDDAIAWAAVAAGAIAPVPLRLRALEAALVGAPARAESLVALARHASEAASPLPMTGYKVGLLEGAVADALERALLADPVGRADEGGA
jgi:xanthine dehydrogenase YagS FAD-binding subunit